MFVKKNKTVGLCVMVVTACLVLAGLWAVLATPETALAEKPDKPPGGGGFKTQDLPANVFFWDGTDAVQSDNGEPYIDGQERITCVIGRNQGQFVLVTSNKTTTGRMVETIVDGSFDPDCDFTGVRVARMMTRRIDRGGQDLRTLTEPTRMSLLLYLYEDRQNLWILYYGTGYKNTGELTNGVLVTPGVFDADGNPTTWDIGTTPTEENPWVSATAHVWRVKDNKWNEDAINCCPDGSFDVPFHLTVALQ